MHSLTTCSAQCSWARATAWRASSRRWRAATWRMSWRRSRRARWAAGAGPRPSSCPRAAPYGEAAPRSSTGHRTGCMEPCLLLIAMMHLVLCSGFIGPLKQCSSTIVNSGYSSLSLGLSLGALCQPYQSDADLGAGEDTALLQSTLSALSCAGMRLILSWRNSERRPGNECMQ